MKKSVIGKIYVEVGEKFKAQDGTALVCTIASDSKSCVCCHFYSPEETGISINCQSYACWGEFREDNKTVVFMRT